MTQKILVVDDEISICDLVKINLETEGYMVEISTDGKDALLKVASFKPDLLILDLMLPGMSGLDICREITTNNPIPIIMLTAKSDLVDRVLGLELGADDYITKPFQTRELLARVKALLRRVSRNMEDIPPVKITNGALEIYPVSRTILLSGSEIILSVKEYELLLFFMNNIEHVFSRDELLEKVWGYDFAGDTRTVDVHIQRLRKKLRSVCRGFNLIQTVFGVGYRMVRQT
jgi:DNA-binding response OmpR family regulator